MSAQTIHILLIEDNPADAELISEYLAESEEAFTLEHVERLSTGLDRLRHGGIEVLLLDLSLPDSQGLETLDRVMGHFHALPVVIFTGENEDALGLEAICKGAQEYLDKGQLTAPLLVRTLRYSFERFRVREQLRQQNHLGLMCTQLPAVLWTTDRELHFTSSLGASLHQLNLAPGNGASTNLFDDHQTNDSDFSSLAAHRRALTGESVSYESEWMERSFQVRIEPLRLGSNVVGTIGVALDVTEQKRIAESFRIARQIQQQLLPRTRPMFSNLDLGGCALFADATGGDFFDFIPLDSGAFAVAIGDASGHGFGPALLAAVVHASLRTLTLTGLPIDVSSMLSTSNRLLCQDSEDDQFVTLFFARLDPGTLTLTYGNAGHPPAILLDCAGTIKARLSATGLPLGTTTVETYSSPPAIGLEPGDLIVFFTDGILEVMSPEGALFSMARALEVVRNRRHTSAQAIADALCAAARDFSGGSPQRDDLTAVVIKVAATSCA
jgi:CheY-like chemotaxis protein